jgi:3-phenylpropionate/trans-cinnamate dioxygenase ferredoxin reductase component
MTGDAAVRGIREVDTQGTVGLIGSEADLPYARPPLSKGMWKGRPFEKVWRQTDKFAVDLFMGRTAMKLDLAGKVLRDDRGDEFSYEKLLLATGGSPNHLPFGNGHIIYFRTLRDYERLRALAETRQRFVVIGAGFIGSEIAAALTMQERKVTMVMRGNAIGGQLFPPDLARFLNDYYAQKGIELLPGDVVESLKQRGNGYVLQTRAGRTLRTDGVVAGLGLQPNVDLARAADLMVDNGVVVDNQLRTSAADVFAAGDVAKFPEAALGVLVRVEHEDNALQMGRQAGRNMAGAGEAYTHTPYFYSDLFDLGYEAVGELSRRLETFADWTEPFQNGVIYYLRDGRVRGVLLWNVWDKRDEAAALLREPGPFTAASLKGRIRADK